MIDNKPGAARCELAIYERWDQMSVNPVAGGGLLWKDIWKRAEEASDENVADNEQYPVGPFLTPNILKTDCSFCLVYDATSSTQGRCKPPRAV